MTRTPVRSWDGSLLGTLLVVGAGRAEDQADQVRALRDLVRQQQKQIEELTRRVNALSDQGVRPAAAPPKDQAEKPAGRPPKSLEPPKKPGDQLRPVKPEGPDGEEGRAGPAKEAEPEGKAAEPALDTAAVNRLIGSYLQSH